MSLVDDVLIETERRRRGSRPARGIRLDDLVPTRRAAADRRAARTARRQRARRLVFVLCAALAVVSGAVVLAIRAPIDPERWTAILRSAPERSSGAPPPVAAARAQDAPGLDPGPSSSSAPEPIRRPTRVESISVERSAAATRLRIVTDGETPHRLEHDAAAARLDVVLANARLVEPSGPLELLDTPIRSLDLRAEAPDLRLALALDPAVRVQSRWLALPRGAALIIDLQGAAPAAIAPTAGDEAVDLASPRHGAELALDPSFEAPLEASLDAPIDVPLEPPLVPEPERLAEVPAALAERVISPSLGDPAELHIARSRQDRERAERAALREQIERSLSAARRARSERRFDEADAHYAEVVLLAPNDRSALVEWSSLLAQDGRGDKAIALLESARAQVPRDPTLLIAHARLLGDRGELPRAIELLDGSGLSVTESPDVHVLAAAYHQRAGEHPAAIERYEQILRRFPEESRGWLGLGVSLEAVGRRDEARDVYRIALQIGELGASSRRWLTTRLAALGQED